MNTQQLTFTRFIAAISIVIFHFGKNTEPFNSKILMPLISKANLGVSYFFLLSGFVMILAYGMQKKINYKRYLINRAARILPLYYTGLFLMLIYLFVRISILGLDFRYEPKLIDVILNIGLLQSWFPYKALSVNEAAWSLSVEFLFYISFPFLLNNIFKKRNSNRIIITAITFFFLSQLVYHYLLHYSNIKHVNLFYHPLLHFNEFLLGIAFGFVYINTKSITPKATSSIVIVAIFIILLTIYYPLHNLNYHNGLLAFIFIPFIYFLAKDNGLIAKLFQNPFLVYLGEISYGIYILQFPIFYFFTASLNLAGIHYIPQYFYIYLILLLLFSAFCYNWIEKPLRIQIKAWANTTNN